MPFSCHSTNVHLYFSTAPRPISQRFAFSLPTKHRVDGNTLHYSLVSARTQRRLIGAIFSRPAHRGPSISLPPSMGLCRTLTPILCLTKRRKTTRLIQRLALWFHLQSPVSILGGLYAGWRICRGRGHAATSHLPGTVCRHLGLGHPQYCSPLGHIRLACSPRPVDDAGIRTLSR